VTDHTNYLGTLANYSVTSVTSGLEKAASLGKGSANPNTNSNSNTSNNNIGNNSKSVSMSGSFSVQQRHSNNTGDSLVPSARGAQPTPSLHPALTRERPSRAAPTPNTTEATTSSSSQSASIVLDSSSKSSSFTIDSNQSANASVSRSSHNNNSNVMNNANRTNGQVVMQTEGLGVIKRIFHRYGIDFKFLILTSHQQLLLV
jgi:hypothetical protein